MSSTASPYSMIDLADVEIGEGNPRKEIGKDAIKELARSLKALGMINPITVREQNGGYTLVAGQRRVLAAREAKLDQVPAYVLSGDDTKDSTMSVAENVIREQLTPLEEAFAYKALLDQHGSYEKVAKLVGKHADTIEGRCRLLLLPESVQSLVGNGLNLASSYWLIKIAERSEILCIAVATLLVADQGEQMAFYDEPADVVDGLLSSSNEFIAYSVNHGWGDPILADDGIAGLLQWLDLDSKQQASAAWDALPEMPKVEWRRWEEQRHRHSAINLTTEQVDAARAYGCLLELPGRNGTVGYVTDPVWCDEAVAERLKSYEPREIAETPAVDGAEQTEVTTEQKREAADADYRARVEARGRNLALGSALMRYTPKPTIEETKVIAKLALMQVGAAGPWAMRLCVEQPTRETTAGKEIVTYPRGGEEREKLYAAALKEIDKTKTINGILAIPVRYMAALQLVDRTGLAGIDREGSYNPFSMDAPMVKLATKLAPPQVKAQLREKADG